MLLGRKVLLVVKPDSSVNWLENKGGESKNIFLCLWKNDI